MLASPQLHGLSSATPERRAKMLALISPDPCLVDESVLTRQWDREAPFLPHPYLEDPEPLFAWKGRRNQSGGYALRASEAILEGTAGRQGRGREPWTESSASARSPLADL